MAVAQSSAGRVTKSQGKGAILGFSSPLIMHCNALAANNVIQQQNGPFRRYRGADGSAQRGLSVIYDCLVVHAVNSKRIHRYLKGNFISEEHTKLSKQITGSR